MMIGRALPAASGPGAAAEGKIVPISSFKLSLSPARLDSATVQSAAAGSGEAVSLTPARLLDSD
eukprot:763994-Hanusia_phi.AAC.2